jgi:predicted nucleotidyltransferase component of viral defense system
MSFENFNTLVDMAMKQSELSTMRPVVEKELLHYDILFALDKENLLDKITFQGGTALRLCYNGQRLSEDLDFAGGSDFQASDLLQMKNCIESYVGARYGLEVSVKEPRSDPDEKGRNEIKVNKWQIRVITAPERPDIPKQMIKVEVASVPAYTSEAKALLCNYDFLPDGYADTLVMVESLNEIMADKLIALPSCQRYIRYRDLWDLQWLKKQGASLDMNLIKHKIDDYKVDNYIDNVESFINNLHKIVYGPEFKAQMMRFIPVSAQENTLNKDKFYAYLETVILGELKSIKQYLSE